MISPYVRRRRLADELVRLRETRGYSADRLAKEIGVARQRISRLENGHVRPDLNETMKILDALGVDGEQWTQLVTIAREAQERGWWESFAQQMGPRQALYANLEAGARAIREYQLTFLPGLLQTPDFTAARAEIDKADWAENFDPARSVEARAGRQRMLRRPGGPTYEVVIDESAVRRLAVPPHITADQLRHLAKVTAAEEKLTVRVLPLDAAIAGHSVPKSAFSIYQYPDAGDPVVVAVETVTSVLVLAEPDEVSHYLTLYDCFKDAALSPQDTADLLTKAAEAMSPTRRNP